MKTIVVAGSHKENLYAPKMSGDVGFDLALKWAAVIPSGTHMFAPTGVQLEMPQGVWCEIVGRSSAMVKHGLLVVHSIIDTEYTGELTIGLINLSPNMVRLAPGTRIAQVIFRESVVPTICWRDAPLNKTERGAQGFGSTGT